jgi:hypothetical protein
MTRQAKRPPRQVSVSSRADQRPAALPTGMIALADRAGNTLAVLALCLSAIARAQGMVRYARLTTDAMLAAEAAHRLVESLAEWEESEAAV